MATTPGIDVSHFNRVTDWEAVAAAGIGFVFIKATDGVTFVDPQAKTNAAGAKAAGLLRGYYHFFRPVQDSVAQAQFLAKAIAADPGELPVVIDVEEAGSPDTWLQLAAPDARVQKVMDFVDEIVRDLGRAPIVYTRSGLWRVNFGGSPAPAQTGCGSWVAEYHEDASGPVQPLPPAPTLVPGWDTFHFWQYSQKGRVAGVIGGVDVDVFNGDAAALKAYAASATGPAACE